MRHRALVLLKVTSGTERLGASIASERPFEVVDVDVHPKLGHFGKRFMAYVTHALALLSSDYDSCRRSSGAHRDVDRASDRRRGWDALVPSTEAR